MRQKHRPILLFGTNCDRKAEMLKRRLRLISAPLLIGLVCFVGLFNSGCALAQLQRQPHSTAANAQQQIIIEEADEALRAESSAADWAPSASQVAAHWQPAGWFGTLRNATLNGGSINLTHLAVDELTESVYLGATNWLLQVSLAGNSLALTGALRTGPIEQPGGGSSCQLGSAAPDCVAAQLAQPILDLANVPVQTRHFASGAPSAAASMTQQMRRTSSLAPAPLRLQAGATLHTASSNASARNPMQMRPIIQANVQQQPRGSDQMLANNYNKLLLVDSDARQLLVCNSLGQGACRRHSLGQAAYNYSELIGLPVASDDEHSSTVGLISSMSSGSGSSASKQQQPVLYVAATNSRLNPNREMVPAISARHLDLASQRALQIVERSALDSARLDISYVLRDYYLVNYVGAFQHNGFVYFATVQRRSQLRELEESGYQTRLARLCLNDMSFQSYVELTIECKRVRSPPPPASTATARSKLAASPEDQYNYNILQDLQVAPASSQVAKHFQLASNNYNKQSSSSTQTLLIGAFAQSKDHTWRSTKRSAICVYSMDQIESKFNENIQVCFNGTAKSRNMNYIAGSVNDCPKQSTSTPTTASTKKSGTQSINYCAEPLKLNGSIALVAKPAIWFDNELVSSVASTLAPTAPLNLPVGDKHFRSHQSQAQQSHHQSRTHQVIVAGTSSGSLKRLVLAPDERTDSLRAIEFDRIQIDLQNEPIMADLHLFPGKNPQLTSAQASPNFKLRSLDQFAIAASAHTLAKVRVNGCKVRTTHQSYNSSALYDSCNACAHAHDPFCGWCTTQSACTTRDECLVNAWPSNNGQATTTTMNQSAAHWTPFDQIQCADYQPISPKYVPVQADSSALLVDVNVRLRTSPNELLLASMASSSSSMSGSERFGARLARAQFQCQFSYSHSRPLQRQRHLSSATTRAMQARLNVHAATVAIGCPLPGPSQRPSIEAPSDHLRTKLSVKLMSSGELSRGSSSSSSLEQALGLGAPVATTALLANQSSPASAHYDEQPEIERELVLYDCTIHTSCRSCLAAGARQWSCAWCPMTKRCTFDASHLEFGCAASVLKPLIAPSATSTTSATVDLATQTSWLNVAWDRLSQCEPMEPPTSNSFSSDSAGVAPETGELAAPASSVSAPAAAASDASIIVSPSAPMKAVPSQTSTASSYLSGSGGEILVASGSRRSIQVALRQALGNQIGAGKRAQALKLECLLEFEGVKARLSARLIQSDQSTTATTTSSSGGANQQQQSVACAETVFNYQTETALLRAQLSVILNELQVIESAEVILYKCHLFGVAPPALAGGASVVASAVAAMQQQQQLQLQQGSTAASSEMFNGAGRLFASAGNFRFGNSSNEATKSSDWLLASGANKMLTTTPNALKSDCSLCDNIDKEFQCVWCSNQCQHIEQCAQLPASTCPPPRIDSIHPSSGPVEGGTLLTIEGANLGSSEREIQDKVSIGGERCQLVLYSVSTRIVCKTPASLYLRQQSSATVSVATRVGISSALEKFHYKIVHLTDVQPRQGPISGGTRLYLSGSNLNAGSRIQVLLDELPCAVDSHDITSNQISCITAPNMLASSQRISKLTLIIDNSTHYLPYPFTYQPDPIITAIEPAESFVSGGRLVMIQGNYLSSPQTIQLLVYNEHKHNIINGTACVKQNDTLVTCLTPAISSDLIDSLSAASSSMMQSPPAQSASGHYYEDLLQAELNELALAGTNTANVFRRQQQQQQRLTSYEMGGLKLKMMLIMDDVRSVRNLDEYYHHLPHYLTYFDDPKLFPLQNSVFDYAADGAELVIFGENLRMKQLDQDMLVTIGSHACPIKSVLPDQLSCEPPQKIAPLFDSTTGRLVDRPLLPIVVLIGAHLRFQVGLMQYSSSQYLSSNSATNPMDPANSFGQLNQQQQQLASAIYGLQHNSLRSMMSTPASDSSLIMGQDQTSNNQSYENGNNNSVLAIVLLLLSIVGFLIGFVVTFMFALSRFRRSKADREYKRIQLQMGSLDINGQPTQLHHQHHFGVGLFDKIHFSAVANGNSNNTVAHITGINNNNSNTNGISNNFVGSLLSPTSNHRSQYHSSQTSSNQSSDRQSVKSRAFDYVGSALLGKTKLFQHFNHRQTPNMGSHLPSFPPSPMTDVSSLIGSSPAQQQHLVRLGSNGNVINSAVSPLQYTTNNNNNHQMQLNNQQQPIYGTASSNGSAQSSPNSSARHSSNNFTRQQQSHVSRQLDNETVIHSNPLVGSHVNSNHLQHQQQQAQLINSRNFNWTQEAPSTIVPYAVIEACNLPLDSENTGKKFNQLQ